MEEHRLTPMNPNYDKELFNSLFKETEKLRNKLVYEIDHRRFGLESRDIKSWFDIKFVYVFNKYADKYQDPNILKAHIIQSLAFFKCRILRKAYTEESLHILENISLDDSQETMSRLDEESQYDDRLESVLAFFKKELTDIAYDIFLLKLYPPEFITTNLACQKNFNKIPQSLIAEFFDIPESTVKRALKSIKETTHRAKYLLPDMLEFPA